jgi:peptidoglycan/xylan/chitin deacetylase (PgdA/CDA1 family)
MLALLSPTSILAANNNGNGNYKSFEVEEGKPMWRGDRDSRLVALTFDDGPTPEFSLKVLKILEDYGVRATFFVVGMEAEQHPDIIMYMDDAGHEIGNHTYSHPRLGDISEDQLVGEIEKTNDVIYKIIRKYPKYFRAPGGRYDTSLRKKLQINGRKLVNWSLNAKDYTSLSPQFNEMDFSDDLTQNLVKRVLSKVTNGDIILFHNGSGETIKALPTIIEELRRRGFGFVTISEMLEIKQFHLKKES